MPPGLTLGGTAEYGYDALDNLRTVSYAGFGGRQQFDEYSYDGRNRLSNSQLEVPMPQPPPVPPPQTTLDLPYSHDDRDKGDWPAAGFIDTHDLRGRTESEPGRVRTGTSMV